MPSGIPYIIGNEVAERFSYYGMKGILVIFMTKYLLDSNGQSAPMSESDASQWVYWFGAANYILPLFGSFLADIFIGKYRTIIWLSIVYCLGHLALALNETQTGLAIGLGLIALGSGGIKPCVSAHVGDQFDESNKSLLDKIYFYFYFAINLGAVVSGLLIPVLLSKFGPHVAFGLPGFLMLIATIVFYLGRKDYIAIKPGGSDYFKELFSSEGLRAVGYLVPIFACTAVFWSLFEQTATSWIIQADKMDLNVNLGFVQFEFLPSQLYAMNPFLILVVIPLFSFLIYPAVEKVWKISPFQKLWIGMIVSAMSFVLLALVETKLGLGEKPSLIWHFWAYVFLTSGEVMISITSLEIAYKQSPPRLKSLFMSFYLASISLGNVIAAGINWFIQNPDGTSKLAGASYFWFFVYLVLGAAVLLAVISLFYKEQEFIQPEELREAP